MELQSLKLLVTDKDLDVLAARHAPRDAGIDNLQVTVTAEGVRATGTYPTLLMNVAFETIWTLAVSEGRLQARLATLRVAGLPAGKFKGLLLRLVRDALGGRPGVAMLEDGIQLDAEEAIREEGVLVRLNLRTVRCEAGRLVVEAGPSS